MLKSLFGVSNLYLQHVSSTNIHPPLLDWLYLDNHLHTRFGIIIGEIVATLPVPVASNAWELVYEMLPLG